MGIVEFSGFIAGYFEGELLPFSHRVIVHDGYDSIEGDFGPLEDSSIHLEL